MELLKSWNFNVNKIIIIKLVDDFKHDNEI